MHTDNLYLDMNGIIHKASHPEDRDQFSAPLTREEMVQNVFQLMDEVIYLIKPQKVLLFAIDGLFPLFLSGDEKKKKKVAAVRRQLREEERKRKKKKLTTNGRMAKKKVWPREPR